MHRAVFLIAALTCAVSFASEPRLEVVVPAVSGLEMPHLFLVGRLGRTIAVESCERISGLTCRIRLLPGQTLPSRMYSTELAADGSALGPKTRVIFPNLRPGERGRATLRL